MAQREMDPSLLCSHQCSAPVRPPASSASMGTASHSAGLVTAMLTARMAPMKTPPSAVCVCKPRELQPTPMASYRGQGKKGIGAVLLVLKTGKMYLISEKKCNGFQCPNGTCISTSKHCNGITDCADASDEQDCGECWGLLRGVPTVG